MRYVALLRGINVGGRSVIKMADLKECVADLGHENVGTYIASGNLFFESPRRSATKLEAELERALEARFELPLKAVVRTPSEIAAVVDAIPRAWIGDGSLRVNVAFLFRGVAARTVAGKLTPREDVDELVTAPGALIWSTRRDALTRTGLKLAGTPVYKKLTIRNLNTALKLRELLEREDLRA